MKIIKKFSEIDNIRERSIIFLDIDDTIIPDGRKNLLDPYLPGWIAEARKKRCRIYGLTARSPTCRVSTNLLLRNLGVDFDKLPFKSEKIYQGCYYTNYTDKAPAMNDMIEKLSFYPEEKKLDKQEETIPEDFARNPAEVYGYSEEIPEDFENIYFIDDLLENHESIEKYFDLDIHVEDRSPDSCGFGLEFHLYQMIKENPDEDSIKNYATWLNILLVYRGVRPACLIAGRFNPEFIEEKYPGIIVQKMDIIYKGKIAKTIYLVSSKIIEAPTNDYEMGVALGYPDPWMNGNAHENPYFVNYIATDNYGHRHNIYGYSARVEKIDYSQLEKIKEVLFSLNLAISIEIFTERHNLKYDSEC